jgi:hypothetical protein
MRGGEDGADALCYLRALYRGEKGQWEAFRSRDCTPTDRLFHYYPVTLSAEKS